MQYSRLLGRNGYSPAGLAGIDFINLSVVNIYQ